MASHCLVVKLHHNESGICKMLHRSCQSMGGQHLAHATSESTFVQHQGLPAEEDINAITSYRLTCFCKDTPLPPVSRGQYPEATTYLSLVTLAISTIAAICAAIRINHNRTWMGFSISGAFLGAMVWSSFLPVTLNELFIIVVPLSYSMGATIGVARTALSSKCDN